MRVVISQSMYFPWVGLLEQIKLADVFVHYDDVQFARGFINRVQIKTAEGSRWLTIPLLDAHRGQKIVELVPDDGKNWRLDHRRKLHEAYKKSPHLKDMLDVFDYVKGTTLAEVARSSLRAVSDYFSLAGSCRFVDSSDLDVAGKSSARLLGICQALGATTYITGHGARNYLDHEIFERAGITVEYMDYRCIAYPQLHGAFTPYVTSLDLIANCGRSGAEVIQSKSKYWREFISES